MERNEGLLGEDWLDQVVWDIEARSSPPRRAPLLLDANDRNMIFADEEDWCVPLTEHYTALGQHSWRSLAQVRGQ